MSDTPTVTVRFEPLGVNAEVASGSTLLEAAHAADVEIDAPCGGSGSCGSCVVDAVGALSPLTHDERELLGGAALAGGRRLACRARAVGDVTVTLPTTPEARIVDETGPYVPVIEPPEERGIEVDGQALGAAIDLGTTTLVTSLIDLRNGDVLATRSALNPQRSFGADVMSRVTVARSDGVRALQAPLAAELERMLLSALAEVGAGPEALVEAAVAGNTAMVSILVAQDVAPLAAAPYEGAFSGDSYVSAPDLGMSRLRATEAYVLPCASAFIGADIVAGVVATALAERTAPALFIDLGTNGEIVLAAGGVLRAASTAAGPALEGAQLTCGMLAAEGAVERVWLDGGDLSFDVIGGGAAAGICGSGVLDLVAALLDAGALDSGGLLAWPLPAELASRATERDGVRAVALAGDVVLTQKDVREVQLALGAVRAGIGILLEEAGLAEAEVAEVVLAGGFGRHVRAGSLVRLGLLPEAWADRLTFAGNTSLAGATMALLCSDVRANARSLASRVEPIDLAARPDFQERFVSALSFPDRR